MKNIKLFVDHGIYTEHEVYARYEIKAEEYYKTVNIEARTMSDMVKKDYLPAAINFLTDICDSVAAQKAAGFAPKHMEDAAKAASETTDKIYADVKALDEAISSVNKEDAYKAAKYYHDTVLPIMKSLRGNVDALELMVGREYWPVPAYSDLLFKV